MKTIEIEDDLYKYILNNIEAFGETPSQILRRLLALSEESSVNNTAKSATQTIIKQHEDNSENNIGDTIKPVSSTSEPIKKIVEDIDSNNDNDDYKYQSVSQLFNDKAFTSEPIITNKFMMMLTTMYFEKKAEFIDAAEKTKGRTRAYLGTHLEELLNSDNEEELAQFKASKPRTIPNTPFWVITNANTGRKRIILTQMMASMGYPHHLIGRIKEEI
ncbi:Negative modulator of initiation of replication [Psychromonas sp. SP041]|uniref:Negative modulator of initiation of replication n=1 Tax=Psychromonas sp. SP041 TaxID=1365007 RepID=UPI00041F5078|nr:Negative modulator of initiation of replication [Psychromonas sp. SP041]